MNEAHDTGNTVSECNTQDASNEKEHRMKRVFLIVLDSFGIGAMPDAPSYGDVGVNTLGSVSGSPYFSMPNFC